MCVRNAFWHTRGSRGVANRYRFVLVYLGVMEVSGSGLQKVFIALESSRQRLPGQRNHKDALKLNRSFDLLVEWQQNVIHNQKAVGSVIGDVGDLPRSQPEIQRIHYTASRWNTQISLKMSVVIPHQRSHAIPTPKAGFLQSLRQAARP